MGNCQATDAATVVIQHPRGRVERLYWPVTARDIMRSNPGYYVALVTLCPSQTNNDQERRENNNNGVRFTRVKLLRPKDMLILGNVYRLVTSQEIMKGLWAKKYGWTKKNQSEPSKQRPKQNEGAAVSERAPDGNVEQQRPKASDEQKQEGHGAKITQPAARSASRHWRPSLHSISEVNRLPQSDIDTS
ncbi:uncharacterized protein LOC131255455 [Magnolia sinica]|uniref:uncharacterized protein LOC131255455 n=1 Tax=Magnolia sinica TaxID=86752 RepID=UPI002658F5E0|nr:uncharacterized protein LOC131255455 [Magnolia sinica]